MYLNRTSQTTFIPGFIMNALAMLAFPSPRGEAAAPRDLSSLVDFLIKTKRFDRNVNNLLAQWGPKNRPLISTQFLPPRLVTENEGTIERVNWRTVAAVDTPRHSPAPLVDGGEIFGSVRYRLRDSKLARQLTAKDYDGIQRYLNQRMAIQAAGVLLGLFDSMLVQALAEHDELANCDAIVTGGWSRRGDNGYFEYVETPNIDNHRVVAADDWSDPTVNPWVDIIARIQVLVNKGFVKSGIRSLTTDQVLSILKSNPYTAIRAGKSNLVTNSDGTVRAQTLTGIITDDDITNIFRSLGVQPPIPHDMRIPTKTGERRAFKEGTLAFVGGTGQTEQVVYNQATPSAVPIQVDDTIGFNGIGIANGRSAPGRQSATRVFENQSDARVEFEGWQTSGPVINVPEALSVVTGIQ